MSRTRKSKPKIGRPPLPPSKVRATPLLIRLTTAERAAYEAAARRAGLSLSAWVRSRCDAGI
jgi:hypothetical protein